MSGQTQNASEKEAKRFDTPRGPSTRYLLHKFGTHYACTLCISRSIHPLMPRSNLPGRATGPDQKLAASCGETLCQFGILLGSREDDDRSSAADSRCHFRHWREWQASSASSWQQLLGWVLVEAAIPRRVSSQKRKSAAYLRD